MERLTRSITMQLSVGPLVIAGVYISALEADWLTYAVFGAAWLALARAVVSLKRFLDAEDKSGSEIFPPKFLAFLLAFPLIVSIFALFMFAPVKPYGDRSFSHILSQRNNLLYYIMLALFYVLPMAFTALQTIASIQTHIRQQNREGVNLSDRDAGSRLGSINEQFRREQEMNAVREEAEQQLLDASRKFRDAARRADPDKE